MAFKIKVKGKTVAAKPSEFYTSGQPEGEFPYESKDHAEAIAWASYASMGACRQSCIDTFSDFEALAEEVDANAGHPKHGKAVSRLCKLEDKIIAKQSEYLRHERAANYVWQSLSPAERQSMGLSFWFNTDPNKDNLYGTWHVFFEGCPKPPTNLRILNDAMLLTPPNQKRAYLESVFGEGYYDESE